MIFTRMRLAPAMRPVSSVADSIDGKQHKGQIKMTVPLAPAIAATFLTSPSHILTQAYHIHCTLPTRNLSHFTVHICNLRQLTLPTDLPTDSISRTIVHIRNLCHSTLPASLLTYKVYQFTLCTHNPYQGFQPMRNTSIALLLRREI